MDRPRKILFVGFPDSPHAARWINLVADQGWELHFFPVVFGRPHALLRGVTFHQPWIKVHPSLWWNSLQHFLGAKPKIVLPPTMVPTRAIYPFPMVRKLDAILARHQTARLGESPLRAPLAYGPRVLARLIRQLKPDLIHSMEFQHAGYTVLRAKELMRGKSFPTWLATNWGSDIYYYRHFPDHEKQITRLLKNIDYYSCECERDIALAREMGMTALAMPVLPNTGGFDIEAIADLRGQELPSQRRTIMVKGYQHFAGRALTALEALETCAESLRDHRILLFSSTSPEVAQRVDELRASHGLDIAILPHSTHAEMLQHFAQARIYLGVSISDAISTSMLEAMAMGAFPIQTNTSCCDEWIEDGISGFSIPPDDVAFIAQRIRTALADDALVNRAAEHNWITVCERLDQRKLQLQEIAFYDRIFNAGAAHGA